MLCAFIFIAYGADVAVASAIGDCAVGVPACVVGLAAGVTLPVPVSVTVAVMAAPGVVAAVGDWLWAGGAIVGSTIGGVVGIAVGTGTLLLIVGCSSALAFWNQSL